MANGMDKSLMALMGLEDDEPKDQGLAPATIQDDSPSGSQDMSNVQNTSQSTSSALPASSDRASSPPLFSPEFNPFGVPAGKIRVLKGAKKNKPQAERTTPSFMFSPTLSPRKVKRKPKPTSTSNTTAPDSSPSPSPSAPSSPSLRTTPVRTESRPANVLFSPPSSLSLGKKPASGLWDSDSDISSIEDDDTPDRSKTRPIVLNATIPSQQSIDTEMLTLTKPSNDIIKDSIEDGFSDLDQNQDSVEDDLAKASNARPEARGGLTQKEILQFQMEKEQVLRTSSLSIQKRVVKKNLASLLSEVQTNPDDKHVEKPLERFELKKTPSSAKPKPLTVALDDSSDDETEQDIQKAKEDAQWKLFVSRSVLAASVPKDVQRGIMKEIQRPALLSTSRRLEIERILQVSPLSHDIQKLSLNSDEVSSSSSSSISAYHPSKSSPQKRSMASNKALGSAQTLSQFHEESKRRLAKMNLARRKQLDEIAKRTGTFKSPEDYAADQLREEEERRRGIDLGDDDREGNEAKANESNEDEEDGDYDPEKEPNKVVLDNKDDEEMELGSADEDQDYSGESEGEDGNVGAVKVVSNDRKENSDAEEGDDEEEDDDSGDEDDEEDEEDKPLTTKRQAKKRTVIGDEDEINVVVIDRSRAPSPSDSGQEDHGSDSEDEDEQESEEEDQEEGEGEEEANHSGNDNSDISDIEGVLDDASGTQGFGAFFEPTMDLSRTKEKKGKLRWDHSLDQQESQNQSSIHSTSYISPVTESDPDQAQSYEIGSISGALDLLSGKFASTTPQSSDPDAIPATLESISLNDATQEDIPSSVEMRTGGTAKPTNVRNAFDIMARAMQGDTESSQPANGLRRLHKRVRERRGPISKNEKSAYIEYEAEEEEDEFMGMGGVDYESDNDQDDYDLADGLVDTTTTLNKDDMENVRQLHMQHEQDQHNKDISDLVQGIAAGNLWKRRNGQIDDLDIFDEEDMDGRFRRKKKLKVTEKFEKLADNPNTAAFAKAFEKHADDDQIYFLNDHDGSDDEAGDSKQENDKRASKSDDEDEVMQDAEYETDRIHSNKHLSDQHDADEDDDVEEEESLNTDKRKEKLRLAKVLGHDNHKELDASTALGTIGALARNQVLPFNVNPKEQISVVSTTLSETVISFDTTQDSHGESSTTAQEDDPIDEYKATMRRSKVIRDIIDGVDDFTDLSSQTLSTSPRKSSSFSAFSILDRIVDQPSLVSSSSVSGSSLGVRGEAGAEDEVRQIAQPRMLARQSSSFLVEERRQQFLSTVSEELRGGQASTRVVKEVNRRRMAFATPKRSSSSLSNPSATTSSTTSTSSSTPNPSSGTDRLLTGLRMLQSLETDE
ncbi:hypothetical protein B0O80DRAFT_523917 [Mortierella sp. GBAus27b]|nr:hypothetical protein BGX31_009766 [Mortierella sp. GBA43]KAI8363332.1 hypothetical protein B0O80DRAFT_523917 [Mortierella sp. GBAus27b]